jgi:hypothetical protein
LVAAWPRCAVSPILIGRRTTKLRGEHETGLQIPDIHIHKLRAGAFPTQRKRPAFPFI